MTNFYCLNFTGYIPVDYKHPDFCYHKIQDNYIIFTVGINHPSYYFLIYHSRLVDRKDYKTLDNHEAVFCSDLVFFDDMTYLIKELCSKEIFLICKAGVVYARVINNNNLPCVFNSNVQCASRTFQESQKIKCEY